MELDDLRWRLFSALASSLAVGCGPAVGIPDGESGSASRGSEGDDDSATSATEGEGSSAATTMSPPTTTSTTSAGESDDDDVDEDDDDGSVKFDLMISDAPLFECPDQPLPPLEVCSAELPSEFDHYRFFCVDVPVDGGCEGWAAIAISVEPADAIG